MGQRKFTIEPRDKDVDRFRRDRFHDLRDLIRFANAGRVETIGTGFGVSSESVKRSAERLLIVDQPCFATAS